MSCSPNSGLSIIGTKGRSAMQGDSMVAVETSNGQHQHIVRCFMHKLAQVVVQSRYGTSINAQDKAPDWVTVLYVF